MLWAVSIVAAGGALGSVMRFLSSVWIAHSLKANFPYATLFVNSVGSFIAGLLIVYLIEPPGAHEYWRLFLMVGVLGGFTTFSAFSWETIALFNAGASMKAIANIAGNTIFSLLFAAIGLSIGRVIRGGF